MNWGMKIILGLGAFMIFIICCTIYMVTSDSDTLVDDEYYETSLSYDDVYSRKQNLENNHAKPTIILAHDTLSIQFTSQQVKGELSLLRASDRSLDKVIPIITNNSIFKLPVSSLTKGNWAVEINWESDSTKYVDNQSIFIQ